MKQYRITTKMFTDESPEIPDAFIAPEDEIFKEISLRSNAIQHEYLSFTQINGGDE